LVDGKSASTRALAQLHSNAHLSVYGSKVVPLTAKGDKNSVEVSNADELIQVLEKLDQAVLGGELDTQIEIASEGVRARFNK
jgi:hypothetical protein